MPRRYAAGMDYAIPAEEGGADNTEHKDGRCVYYSEWNIALCLCPMGRALHRHFISGARGCM
ncbi:MAG: hypothetical protein LBK73_13180 [Treponema sp.]|jgi:hypothetical protein|nr:hypothetical protein [Treponema sp.]